ncbi:MAG: hypothetical protein ACYC96_15680 [Fimbriimonadaceae bacterium]
MFHVNPPVSSGGSVITLTLQQPFYAPLKASMSATGTWLTGSELHVIQWAEPELND